MIGLDRAVAYAVSLDFFGVVGESEPDAFGSIDRHVPSVEGPEGSEEPVVPLIGSSRPGNRKADGRRVIASYTRAFLRASRVRLPSRKGIEEKIQENGPEAFLEWAYGLAYSKGRFWYEAANPRLFFEYLLLEHAANRPPSRPRSSTRATVEDAFCKSSAKSYARWVVREDVEERFGFDAEDLVRVAVAMRGRAFIRKVSE
jgi:hypothetical protein